MYDHKIDLYLSTSNQGKLRELEELIDLNAFVVHSKAEAGFKDLEVEEDADTLEGNAFIKARALREALLTIGKTGWVIADDTGLFVDALNGEPGVHAARYAGEQHSDDDNNEKLLHELSDVPDEKRTAHFETVIALITETGEEHAFRGQMRGQIAREYRGEHGFGYDPIFWLPEMGKMLSELNDIEKNEVSHRGNAYRAFQVFAEENKIEK